MTLVYCLSITPPFFITHTHTETQLSLPWQLLICFTLSTSLSIHNIVTQPYKFLCTYFSICPHCLFTQHTSLTHISLFTPRNIHLITTLCKDFPHTMSCGSRTALNESDFASKQALEHETSNHDQHVFYCMIQLTLKFSV